MTFKLLKKLKDTKNIEEMEKIIAKIPDGVRKYPALQHGMWCTKVTTLNDAFKELKDILEKISRDGGGGHMMEQPWRFYNEFYTTVNYLFKIVKFADLFYMKFTFNKILMDIYEEVKYRPGNSGYSESKDNFTMNLNKQVNK